jgi:hypothetical protein
MYSRRNDLVPPPASQFWITGYAGIAAGYTQVTPLIVTVDGLPDPPTPQAYAITLAVGHLVIQGVRFTTSGLEMPLDLAREAVPLWPTSTAFDWPVPNPVEADELQRFALGAGLKSRNPRVSVTRWRPATDLVSNLVGRMIEQPAPCGEHVLYYPVVLAEEAARHSFHAFATVCECGTAYLIEKESDGAHVKAAGSPAAISARYEELCGDEFIMRDPEGDFVCKRLAALHDE